MSLKDLSRKQRELLAEALRERELRREKRACEESLASFIKAAWHVIEPGQPYVHGWHIDTLCEHLEAITDGVEIDGRPFNRFLANVPPGMMKSLSVAVMWPAWEWGPRNMPHLRYVCASHSQSLAIRDSTKMRRLIVSDWYQQRWGDRVRLTGDQNAKTKFETTATGFREAIATGSITGARGDRVIIDDPHSVEGASSDAMRASTLEWFSEAVPTRLNNPISSAIVVIMQRFHEEDVSAFIINKGLGYEHMCLPMEFDPGRRCETGLGFVDPRTFDGELLFPERFPQTVVDRDKHAMGPYATAGQFQQSPSPRGGGIIKREWWLPWDDDECKAQGVPKGSFPAFDFVVASLDTAYDEKADQNNDPSALTVWGVWSDRHENKRLMLINAWEDWLELHPLVEKVAKTCQRFKVDKLLIEAKASGKSVAQEIRRLHAFEGWGVQLIDPGRLDKISRAYSVQHMFSGGLVYAPDRSWADKVIDQCAVFPRGKHDDLVDTATMATRWLRDVGMIQRPEEVSAAFTESIKHRPIDAPIYDV